MSRWDRRDPILSDMLRVTENAQATPQQRQPIRADAHAKCRCGATLLQPLDEILHTAGTGVCSIVRRGAGRDEFNAMLL
jgi:hypothetical protein